MSTYGEARVARNKLMNLLKGDDRIVSDGLCSDGDSGAAICLGIKYGVQEDDLPFSFDNVPVFVVHVDAEPRAVTTQAEYDEYEDYIRSLSPELKVMELLRETRFVEAHFPPRSSGAGDMIEVIMDELREYWGLPSRGYNSPEWEWNKR